MKFERRCSVCRKRCKKPFASLKFGTRAAIKFCSFDCLDKYHVNQIMDLIHNYCDLEFVEKMNIVLKARAEILQKDSEINGTIKQLPPITYAIKN